MGGIFAYISQNESYVVFYLFHKREASGSLIKVNRMLLYCPLSNDNKAGLLIIPLQWKAVPIKVGQTLYTCGFS